MIALTVKLDGVEPIWPELAMGYTIFHLGDGAPPIQISGLQDGLESGNPSVMIRLDIDDHRVVLAETSLKLFLFAADALKAKFGDPRLSADELKEYGFMHPEQKCPCVLALRYCTGDPCDNCEC